MGYSPLNHTVPLFKPTDSSEPTGWAQVLGPPSLPPLPGTNISGTLLVPPTLPFAHSALSPRDTFALSLVSPCCTPHSPRSVLPMPTTFSKRAPFSTRDNGHHLSCRTAVRQGGGGLGLSCGEAPGTLRPVLPPCQPSVYVL